MLQRCHFSTNITAITIMSEYSTKPIQINLRMSESSFSLTTHDIYTRVIYRQGRADIYWMLWKTQFQINSFHTMSSDRNFTQNINRIVSYGSGHSFYGTISETQYASGKGYKFHQSWHFPFLNTLQQNQPKTR